MSTATEKLTALLKSMREIVDGAKALNRDLNEDEISTLEAKNAEVVELKATIERQRKGDALMRSVAGLPTDDAIDHSATPGSPKGHIFLSGMKGKDNATRIANAFRADGQKSLVPVGSVTTTIPLNPDPITIGVIPTTVLETLPATVRNTPIYRYLRQTVRTNNAAIVKAGDVKPTSVVTVEPIDGQLQVFAHISEPVDEYLLKDTDTLQSFISTQLLLMLREAVEGEILSGNGSTGHLRGIVNTSGIQTQAYATDKVTTLRLASLALETAGHTADVFILNAADWAAIETTRATAGSFDLGGPVDRAAQKLWGVQVVTTTRLASGTALAVDRSCLGVDTDGQIDVKWDSSTGFDKNQVRARVEGRFGLSVYQPAGIVKATLTSA